MIVALIVTGVDTVMLNFGTPEQSPIHAMTRDQAEAWMRDGHFAEGSMKPKIQAALNFLNAVDGEVIITSPRTLGAALNGTDGTRITR